MKRPPGLWVVLSAGVLWLCLQDVYGIRATSLIFGKSTTSTTTEAAPDGEEVATNETGSSTESSSLSKNDTENANSTTPTLTGVPQVDYIWDPNLPKELNGYNLSEYPFYERVPDVLDFKCDGLHDGFYASIPHKCQVYHHCLFGTRYDFLCANYTAFDQKTFICQFVSDVDCVNSKKFWHRNDALYQAQSTTAAPSLKASIYTTAPPDAGEPITPLPSAPRPRPGRPYRPRPRRPPPVEYDDEIEDYDYEPRPARVKRPRPKPRPRPIYDDEEYDEYYDDPRYERRGSPRRPPPRNNRNTKRRRRPVVYDDEEEELEVDDRFEDEDFVAAHKRPKNGGRRKTQTDDYEEAEDRSRERAASKRRPYRKKNRRPVYEDEYEDELPQTDDGRNYDERPRKKPKKEEDASTSDGRPIIKPATGTIYDRPRVAPRINLPVPKNAADKYAYKAAGSGSQPTSNTAKASAEVAEDEYEDEVEDVAEKAPKRPFNRRTPVETKRERPDSKTGDTTLSRHSAKKPDTSEEVAEKAPPKPKQDVLRSSRYRPSLKKIPPTPVASEEYEEYEDEASITKSDSKSSSIATKTTTTTTTTTTTEAPKKEPIMRIIKRPFLPSRGGNPYSPRGLQPVGLKASNKNAENDPQETGAVDSVKESTDYIEDSNSKEQPEELISNGRKPFKPSPVIVKVPIRSKYAPPTAETQELINSEPSRLQTYKTKEVTVSQPTQKPVVEKNPLDVNEYDVTLNDALNPTLPNLPVRAFPTGFGSAADYSYNTYNTRPRYVLEPVISPSNQNFVFPQSNKVVRSQQRNEGGTNGRYVPYPGQTQALLSGY